MNNIKKKILVIRYRFIGDTVLLIPFLRNLRKAEPDAQIDLTITTLTYPLLKNCPYVDNFIFIDTKKSKDTYERDNEQYDYKKIIKQNRYTHAFILKRSFSAAWLAFASGIKNRIGFDTECRGFLLTEKVKYRKDIHESQAFLDILRKENYKVDSGYLELFTDEFADNKAHELLKHVTDDIVIVHSTSGNKHKQWGLDNWCKVIKHLSNMKNKQVIFLGALIDRKIYDKIVANCGELNIKPINLCGQLSLEESISIIKMAKLMVGCDSGNLHIAAALHIPVIGIYGPMPVEKWGALGDNNTLIVSNEKCYPCSLKTKCKNNYKCLSSITIKEVLDAIDKYNI